MLSCVKLWPVLAGTVRAGLNHSSNKDGFLIYRGEDNIDIDGALPDPTSEEGNDVYKVLIRKIDNQFMPKQNKRAKTTNHSDWETTTPKSATLPRKAQMPYKKKARSRSFEVHDTEQPNPHQTHTIKLAFKIKFSLKTPSMSRLKNKRAP